LCETGGAECCANRLIDSNSERVALETSRAIDDGTYRAIRLRLCSTESVTVGLWRRADDDSYLLHWHTTVSPTARQTTLSYLTVTTVLLARTATSHQMSVDRFLQQYTNDCGGVVD